MKVIRKGEVTREEMTHAPIFVGGKVSRQDLVGAEISKYFIFGFVEFGAGARNKFHSHTSDQILFVTKGRGIVATEDEEVVVREGDTILIPVGEKHWHGAAPDSDFTHIQVRTSDSETQILE